MMPASGTVQVNKLLAVLTVLQHGKFFSESFHVQALISVANGYCSISVQLLIKKGRALCVFLIKEWHRNAGASHKCISYSKPVRHSALPQFEQAALSLVFSFL